VLRSRLLYFIAIVVACQAHTAPAESGLDEYSRRAWETQDGLPEDTVQAFAQTPDRYLWIGTTGGLVRFDEQFLTFNRENTPISTTDLAIDS
jgi:ligand-binding sensor domain-containing protein